MDAKEIRELLRFVRDAGFHEFELENEGLRLRVVKNQAEHAVPGNGTAGVVQVAALPAPMIAGPAPVMVPAAAAAPAAAPAQAAAAEPAKPALAPDIHEQASPMVGTFYRAARPGTPSFVNVGDRVVPGQTLCIIEAMKLMNEIEAEVAGVLVEVVPQNAQPVEYGEVLFRIKKDA